MNCIAPEAPRMHDAGHEEDDGEVMGVVKELVVLLAKVRGDDDHDSEAQPRNLSERYSVVVKVNLYEESRYVIKAENARK